MNKRILNLLKEKIKLEKVKDQIVSRLLQRTLGEIEWSRSERNELLNELKKIGSQLATTQSQLELELSNALLE